MKTLTKRFDFRRVVFVGDRGMVTESNVETLQEAAGDGGFLVGMRRRQNPEAEALIDRLREDRWIECVRRPCSVCVKAWRKCKGAWRRDD